MYDIYVYTLYFKVFKTHFFIILLNDTKRKFSLMNYNFSKNLFKTLINSMNFVIFTNNFNINKKPIQPFNCISCLIMIIELN